MVSAISAPTIRNRPAESAVMTFLGVPIFEWAGLALALGLGLEAWLTIRKPSSSDDKDEQPKG